ncbi:hypothetical protein [Actinokineospora fastidiosa]|uniref:Uncharacterized protein n=1 Tax=Actinokineospora fastidiosa TaxID=1816 RepID=A0A918LCR8_9PSEU|nr:hypothetical protein [Actinokineospora fastidiosa]GGS32288.1 hypothetical protein GCM10010171_27790 [Actinokineospora fastidiosa]
MAANPRVRSNAIAALNSKYHRVGLFAFLVIVLGHWAEHIVQAVQIYALDWPRPQAGGVLGLWFPWLVKSELMHYGYALVMLVGFVLLRHGFHGRARTWWMLALWVQVWHHFEHLLLFLQALTGQNLLGQPAPTSILQLVLPRVELHLFYNAIVFIPMVVAMVLHRRPRFDDLVQCSCAPHRTPAAVG